MGRSKTVDSEAILKAVEANLVRSIQRVSGELGISPSSLICHLWELQQMHPGLPNCASCMTKILQNFWFTLALCTWNEETIALVYKNINYFLYYHERVEMAVRERERERETEGCYCWYHMEIDIFNALLLLASLMGSQPGVHLAKGWCIYSLAALQMTDCMSPPEVKKFPHYIFPGHWRIFHSRSIQVIHFCYPFFTPRHRCNILFTKFTITSCQRSICNTSISFYFFCRSLRLTK